MRVFRPTGLICLVCLVCPLCLAGLSSCATTRAPQRAAASRARLERRVHSEAALGMRAFRAGRYREAIQHLERVHADVRRLGAHRYLDGTLYHLAAAHALQGHHARARGYLEALLRARRAALGNARPRQARLRLALAWRDMAWLGIRSDDLDRALEANAKALQLIRPLGAPLQLSALHQQLSMILERRKEIERSVAHARRALEVVRDAGSAPARRRIFSASLRLATLYRMKLYDYRRAEDAINRALGSATAAAPRPDPAAGAISPAPGSSIEETEQAARDADAAVNRGRALLELARLRAAQSRYREARDAAEQALSLLRGAPAPHRSAAYLEVANSSYYLRDLPRVLEAVKGGLEAVKGGLEADEGNQLRRLQLLNARGTTLALLGRGGPAIEALGQALRIARALKQPSEVSATLNNLGWAQLLSGNLRAAQERFVEARDIDRARGDLFGLSFDLANLGVAEELAGRRREARAHLQEALALSRRIKQRLNLLKSLAALGRIALAEGRLPEGAARFETGKKIADRLALEQWRWRFRLLAARAALRQRREREARGLLEEAAAIMERGDRGRLKIPAIPKGLEDPRDVFTELAALLRRLGERAAAARVQARMKRVLR